MLYMIQGNDAHNSFDRRLAARPAHLERLQALQAAGRLILAGPCPAIDSPDPGPAGFSGSLIVAEFPSLEAAKAWGRSRPLRRRRRVCGGGCPTVQEGAARMSGVETLRARLAALDPVSLDIRDDSARHAGHAGARAGGHFALTIVSPRFAGLTTMQRHRLVYDAVGDLVHCGIHALSISARTPEESRP